MNDDKKITKADYDEKLSSGAKSIENIIDVLKTKKINFDEASQMLQDLNSLEKQITDYASAVSSINITAQINNKVDELFKIIEKAFDVVLSCNYEKIATSKLSKAVEGVYSFTKDKGHKR